MTIPENIKQEILWYFENYWNVVTTIANQRNEIIYKGIMRDELDIPIHCGTSDTTGKKALQLSNLDIDEMMDWIRVINDTYHYFQGNDKGKANLIWMTYLEKNPRRKTKNQVIDELFVSRDVYYNWINDICGIAGLKAASRKLIEI
jgi:hypothetical protein